MPPLYHPLGLLYVGTMAQEAGHLVRLVDIDSEKMDESGFTKLLSAFQPDAVGLTATTPTLGNAVKWATLVKHLCPSVPIILGGIHATTAPEAVSALPCFDFAAIGEGERTLLLWLDCIASDSKIFNEVAGLAYRQDGRFIRTLPRPLEPAIDTFPVPDRKLLKFPLSFAPANAVHMPVATIMTSRGCPGDCTFCCTKHLFTRKVRLRSVDNILSEIDMLVRDFGVREIHIADDTFTANRKRVMEFCEQVRARHYDVHFEFMNGIRADFVDDPMLKALRSIQVRNVGFGVESGNEEVLRLAKKGISMDKVRKAFSLAKANGFETWGFFIIGLPGDNSKRVRETVRFAKELDPDFAKFYILKPYPGSEAYAWLQERGLIDCTDYDAYGIYSPPVHHLPEMDVREMERLLKWAYRTYYLNPRKILQHLLRLRSFTQFRLMVRNGLFVLKNLFRKKKV